METFKANDGATGVQANKVTTYFLNEHFSLPNLYL